MRLHHTALVSSSESHADKFYQDILKLKKIKTSILQSELASELFEIDAECILFLYGNEDFAIEVFVTKQLPSKKEPFTHSLKAPIAGPHQI